MLTFSVWNGLLYCNVYYPDIHQHWDLRVIMMPTLSSLVAPQVVIMTTCSATSDANLASCQLPFFFEVMEAWPKMPPVRLNHMHQLPFMIRIFSLKQHWCCSVYSNHQKFRIKSILPKWIWPSDPRSEAVLPQQIWHSTRKLGSLLLVWTSNCIHYKVWNVITYPFQGSHLSFRMDE